MFCLFFSKDILEEYSRFTNHSAEDFSKCHQVVDKSIQNIKPGVEYDDFLNKFRYENTLASHKCLITNLYMESSRMFGIDT